MRYLLRHGNISELYSRIQYLYDTFHLWFVNTGSMGDFEILEAFPFNIEEDIVLLYGHNREIQDLLKRESKHIREKYVYIIACKPTETGGYFVPQKHIFVSPQIKKSVELLRGEEFGFDFDITEVELNLYNSYEENIFRKLNTTFKCIS